MAYSLTKLAEHIYDVEFDFGPLFSDRYPDEAAARAGEVPIIADWLEAHVGELNTLIYTDFAAANGEVSDPFGDEENGQKTFVAYGYCYGFEDEKCICDYVIDKEEIFEIAKQLCNQGISATLKAKNVDCEYEGIYYFDI